MKWSVKAQLAGVIGVLLAIMVTLAVVGIDRDRRIETSVVHMNERSLAGTRAVADAAELLERMRARTILHAATKDAGEMRQLEDDIRRMQLQFDQAIDRAEGNAETDLSRRSGANAEAPAHKTEIPADSAERRVA